MNKIKGISAFIAKLNNGARFVKVCIRSIEFFNEELNKEFPSESEPLKTVKDESIISK